MVFDRTNLFREENHLHIRRIEVNLTELEYHNVIPILADRDVIPKGVVMIALSLVQYLIHVVDASYDQLLTIIGGRADLSHERIPGVMYPVAVRLRFAARVNRVQYLEAVRAGGEHAEQEQKDREAIVSHWQPHS